MMEVLEIIGRNKALFEKDKEIWEKELTHKVQEASFLVLGGAGSIGQAVCKEIFKRQPKKLHVVDINENNLVELVRDIRSSFGYIEGDFKTFSLDIGSFEYDAFFESDGNYDYILNLSALKHVRSERDPFTLMRMIQVNILNTIKTVNLAIQKGVYKYFCVSTDKAANPVNMMGASKRIMELFLWEKSTKIDISTARFANVAFSDGSLLYGFNQRILKKQPIVAPNDVKRYFVTPQESGELCLFSCLLGENRDIFFPKLSEELHLISFSDIAIRYLHSLGLEPYICDSEEEARNFFSKQQNIKFWPCYFSGSDTTGEKDFEEFFTEHEIVDMKRFAQLGIIKNEEFKEHERLSTFLNEIAKLKEIGRWNKEQILNLFQSLIPEFQHLETGKYLDNKM